MSLFGLGLDGLLRFPAGYQPKDDTPTVRVIPIGTQDFRNLIAANAEAEREQELLRQHGKLWYAGATWVGDDGSETSFRSGPYVTEAEHDTAMRERLIAFGYKKPRWWQWSRRNEHPYWRYLDAPSA